MKNVLRLLIFISLLTSCNTEKSVVASHTGDGTSSGSAVLLQEKKKESELNVEAKAWLNEKYPGYTLLSLEGKNEGDKILNVYRIKTAEGQELTVYFDASLFYNSQKF